MNLAAIRHHAYDNFCYQLDDDTLEINLLTGRDVEEVSIVSGDPFDGGIPGGSFKWNGRESKITRRMELETHLLWTTALHPEFKRARYYFILRTGSETIYYLETGFFTPKEFKRARDPAGCFTFPWMNSADIRRPPEWPERTVWYQIFPSRFCRGKSDFIPEKMKPWGKYGENVSYDDVFGGNLQGIIDRLDYLENLGISGIYMTPINLSPSQHKYDTTDYLTVDPAFGSNETLRTLVREAHRRKIRVMLDGVFNHSGWQFFAWQDVLKNREKSKYANWFMINNFKFGQPSFQDKSGDYYTFAFCDYMPKLNTNNPDVRRYLIGVCETWVTEYDIDALRLDVANEISHVFCRELSERMRALKPDFYIIGEIWHNALPWLRDREFDAVMNYPLQDIIADFCSDKTETVKSLEHRLNRCYSMYYRQTNRVLFNQMDSHDTIRIRNRCGSAEKAMQALALLFLMPGSVCIYYGTEILLEGEHDPDNRRCMPWPEIENGLFAKEIRFMKTLIELRRTHPALSGTEMHFAYTAADPDGEKRIVRMTKASDDGTETVKTVINCGWTACDAPDDGQPLLAAGFSGGRLSPGGILFLREKSRTAQEGWTHDR